METITDQSLGLRGLIHGFLTVLYWKKTSLTPGVFSKPSPGLYSFMPLVPSPPRRVLESLSLRGLYSCII